MKDRRKLVRLIPAIDEHFAWFLGEADRVSDLQQPEGGLDLPGTLRMLRRLTARLHNAGCQGHWIVADGNDLVGLCGYKQPPDIRKTVEIGYGIAPAHRKKGYAVSAVSLLLIEARKDADVEVIFAETSVNNRASQIVLERNQFSVVGKRHDEHDGDLMVWNKVLA